MVFYKIFDVKNNQWMTKYCGWTNDERKSFAHKTKAMAQDRIMRELLSNNTTYTANDILLQEYVLVNNNDFDSDVATSNYYRKEFIARKFRQKNLTDLVGKLLDRQNWDEFKYAIVFQATGGNASDVKETLKNSGITKGSYRTTRNAIAFKSESDLFLAQLAFAEDIKVNVIDLEEIFNKDKLTLISELKELKS